MIRLHSLPLLRLTPIIACVLAPGLAGAQVTSGTVTAGDLVGDPDSPFAVGLPFPASPIGNPFVEPSHPDRPFVDEQVQLGKALFWDEQLSADNSMACGSCHAFKTGGTDIRDAVQNRFQKFGSAGVLPQDGHQNYFVEPILSSVLGGPGHPNSHKRTTPLFAPSMINATFFEELFWQKRVGPEFEDLNGNVIPGFSVFAALEALAVEPPISPIEMGHDRIEWESGNIQKKLSESKILRLASPQSVPADIAYLLGSTYHDAFENLYGTSSTGNPVTRERVAMSIAQYLRTLVSDQAPVLLPGGLTMMEMRAFKRMQQNICFTCHSNSGAPEFDPNGGFVNKFDGVLSRGDAFSILSPPHHEAPDPDTGQMVTANMKVPSLLNLGLRRRFFHSGHIEGVDQLIAFFNGELPTSPTFTFNPPLGPLEKVAMRDLWTRGFVDPRVEAETFPFDSPDLHSERLRLMGPDENQFGSSTFAVRPVLYSNVPATLADPWFKAGLTFARPGALSQFGLSASATFGGSGLLLGGPVSWSLPIMTDSDGSATWWIEDSPTVPPGLAGSTWFGQWRTQDPSAPSGSALTRAASFRLF